MNWNKNIEPDLSNYNVYRGYVSSPGVEPSSYDSIANTTDSTYTDELIFLYETGSGACYTLTNYAYKISSVDNTNKKSVKSEKAAITGYQGNCDPAGDNFLQTFLLNPENFKKSDDNNIESYKLYNNYPNPFNPTTNITFDLPEVSFVSLKVYDVMGKEIETLVNENRQKGRHLVIFNAVNLASGIYYYKLVAIGSNPLKDNNLINIKKMILLK